MVETPPSKIELSAGLKELLNLTAAQEHNGVMTGQPVDKYSINFTFSHASMVFLVCDQVDDTYVNDKPTKTIAVIPIASATNGILATDSPTIISFRENYNRKLNFRLQDENSNELPVKQMLARFTIND